MGCQCKLIRIAAAELFIIYLSIYYTAYTHFNRSLQR